MQIEQENNKSIIRGYQVPNRSQNRSLRADSKRGMKEVFWRPSAPSGDGIGSTRNWPFS